MYVCIYIYIYILLPLKDINLMHNLRLSTCLLSLTLCAHGASLATLVKTQLPVEQDPGCGPLAATPATPATPTVRIAEDRSSR